MTINELLASVGLTANDVIPFWDAEASGSTEPTQKITAQNFAAAIKTLASLLGTSDVVNNLTSTSTTAPLSAAQGKALQDGKVAKSGDTMTGNLTAQKATTTVVAAKCTTTGVGISMSSQDGANHGVMSDGYYSNGTYVADAKWLVYRNPTGRILSNGLVAGNAFVKKTTNTGSKSVKITPFDNEQIFLVFSTVGKNPRRAVMIGRSSNEVGEAVLAGTSLSPTISDGVITLSGKVTWEIFVIISSGDFDITVE